MKARAIFTWLVLVLVAASPAACGDDDNDNNTSEEEEDAGMDGGSSETEDDAGSPDAEVEDAAEDAQEDSGEQDVDAGPAIVDTCGDGVLDEGEVCDDGDNDNFDGCTVLCEYSCEFPEDCLDLDICDGQETCDFQDHVCLDGERPEDGTECGDQSGCREGECLPFLCGDAIVQEDSVDDEECDDGNLVEEDGCTPECKYTCISTDSSRDCTGGDECAPPMACDDDEHVCEEAGSAPAEKSLCDGGTGWCIQGQCVPYECGDGEITGTEQCDEGDENGKPDSGCSLVCRIVSCGNGDIEDEEECDDGNRTNLDGCTSGCQAEAVFRLTRMDVLQEPPPDFCEYDTNAFGSAFLGEINRGGLQFNFLETAINGFLASSINAGRTNSLVQFLDAEDRTGRTVDDDMRLGIYSGIPAEEWPGSAPEQQLDFPFLVEPRGVDEDNQPTSVIKAQMLGAGLNRTTEPADVDVRSPLGRLEFMDAMAQSVVDVLASSRPPPPPEVSHSVLIPRTFGVGEPIETQGGGMIPGGGGGGTTYRSEGRLCGAISVRSMVQVPIGGEQSGFPMPVEQLCCPAASVSAEPYVGCVDGVELPDCASFYDLVRGGCHVYIQRMGLIPGTAPAGGEEGEEPEGPTGCDPPEEDEIVLRAISPTEPDVDTDGDGENDAYTAVIGFQGNRVKIVGVAEEDDE